MKKSGIVKSNYSTNVIYLFFLLFFKFGRKMSVFYGISDRYEFGTNG